MRASFKTVVSEREPPISFTSVTKVVALAVKEERSTTRRVNTKRPLRVQVEEIAFAAPARCERMVVFIGG